jgi:hypothetical protein
MIWQRLPRLPTYTPGVWMLTAQHRPNTYANKEQSHVIAGCPRGRSSGATRPALQSACSPARWMRELSDISSTIAAYPSPSAITHELCSWHRLWTDELVRLLPGDDHKAEGVGITPEQVTLPRGSGDEIAHIPSCMRRCSMIGPNFYRRSSE